MGIRLEDRGDATGARSIAFSKTGVCPSSSPGLFIVLQSETSNNTPFVSFNAASAPSLTAAFGNAIPPGIEMTLLDLNAVTEKWQHLDGLEGCTRDRILGISPPWLCFLPGICCIGGYCLATCHTSQKVRDMKGDIERLFAEAGGNHMHGTWHLCAGSHTSKVMVENRDRVPGETRHRLLRSPRFGWSSDSFTSESEIRRDYSSFKRLNKV
jgi:hypothetical protein